MKIEHAYRRAMKTVVKWIQEEVDSNKTQVFFRTFAPVHFRFVCTITYKKKTRIFPSIFILSSVFNHPRGGDWRTGGTCHMETPPDFGASLVPSETWEHLKLLEDVLSPLYHSSASSSSQPAAKLRLLNITAMAAQRNDGHPSLYYLGSASPAPVHRQDCSHWCLPGVPDAWNEILFALFLKHEGYSRSNRGHSDNFT